MHNRLVAFEDTVNKDEQILYAFLAEEEKRTGSRRTVVVRPGPRRADVTT